MLPDYIFTVYAVCRSRVILGGFVDLEVDVGVMRRWRLLGCCGVRDLGGRSSGFWTLDSHEVDDGAVRGEEQPPRRTPGRSIG
jgi:hypothetical protein